MASQFKRLEITPDLLDLGTAVVRLDKIASVGRAEQRPLRLLGIGLILIAVLLVGFEVVFNLAAFSLKTKGSLKIWAACGAAGVGVFCVVYARRCLAITLVGGSRIMLRIASLSFADELLDALRRALSLKPGATFHVIADLTQEKLTETEPEHVGAPRFEAGHPGHLAPSNLPHQRAALGGSPGMPGPASGPAPMSGAGGAWIPPQHGVGEPPRPAVHAEFHPHALGRPGLGGPSSNGNVAAAGAGMPARQGPTGPAAHAAGGRGPMPINGAYPGPASAHAPMPANQQPTFAAPPGMGGRPHAPAGNRDLAQLIDFILRSEIQHKDTLLELLRVVEDHEMGGRTSREDALAHWKSFSDYVIQYLTGVDGLPALTAQTARSLTRIG